MLSIKSKCMIHVGAFLGAFLVIFSWVYILPINNFGILLQRNCSDNKKNCQVEDALNAGKIVMFGSSEITLPLFIQQKYSAINFFARQNKPILYDAGYGFRSLGMLSQILAYYNQNIQNNARIVVILSPMSFYFYDKAQTLVKYSAFIKNYELKQLLFIHNEATQKYKNYVIECLKKRYKIHIPMIRKNVYRQNPKPAMKKYEYNFQPMTITDYNRYFQDASNIEKNLDTNNSWGVHNDFLANSKKYLQELKIRKGMAHYNMFQKKEYLDTIMLIKFLSQLKIKPLFIMQDDLGYDFDIANKDRKLLLPFLKNIKEVMKENGMGYLDLWTYKKADIIPGKLVDQFHVANVGWVMINRKIMDYFSQKGY